MKQYCRYCSFCFAADDYRCSVREDEPHWTREQINKPNKCRYFTLSELGDVDTGKMYKPKTERVTSGFKGQITLWEESQ